MKIACVNVVRWSLASWRRRLYIDARRAACVVMGLIFLLVSQSRSVWSAPPTRTATELVALADVDGVKKDEKAAPQRDPLFEGSMWDPSGIADFDLIERSGKKVTRADLLGKPWVVCFIFTRCVTSCPRITEQMRQLQQKLKGVDVRLVTITVDPEFDTPEVLKKHAELYGADKDKWLFLSGDQAVIYRLIIETFKMPVQQETGERRKPGYEVAHSNNILLVDAKGRVLRKYLGTEESEVAALARDLKSESENPGSVKPQKFAITMQAPREDEDKAAGSNAKPIADEGPPWIRKLPAVNASLNGLALLLLLCGFAAVRKGVIHVHKRFMLSAFVVSTTFLACYVLYHVYAGSKPFTGTGPLRTVYFAILISHIVLAIGVAVLAPMTIFLGLSGRISTHRALARVTFPIWLYVSVTGVIIYLMLYQLAPLQIAAS